MLGSPHSIRTKGAEKQVVEPQLWVFYRLYRRPKPHFLVKNRKNARINGASTILFFHYGLELRLPA